MYGYFSNFEEVQEELKNSLSNKRYIHSVGVVKVAEELAKLNGVDVEKAKLAALLHDCAKELSDDRREDFCIDNNIDLDYLKEYKSMIHSHLGYYYAKLRYGIEDEEILNAIKYHTSGRAGMSELEEIIYLADFLDPNRDVSNYKENYEKAKEYAYRDLKKGMKFVLERMIVYLEGKKIYEDTLDAYLYYKNYRANKKDEIFF